ncbi:hypothetical protein CBR_g39660 [Chara braunii]|uniref:Uncharacterized protein n=1 Tax=Chara braunii TaxID=69332 RepID=A0A388K1G8_CHABU|nr:hypothetical protein CBR_g39660 [Chara braunii]|eukprot:GBG63879.1 hypothetical protein CBR_g39660 [Chara braunii]
MSAVPHQKQCHISSATSARQQYPATMTVSVLGMPGQLANESIAEYRQRFQAQLALIEAEEQRQAAAAEKQRLQAEADGDTQACGKEAQDLLQRHEAANIEKLKFWHFEPSEHHEDATPEEQHKEFIAKLVTRLVYTCNHLQSELVNLRRAVLNHKDLHEDATRALDSRVQDLEQVAPRQDAGDMSLQSNRTTLWKTRQPPKHHMREIRWPAAKQQQLLRKREGENRIAGWKWTASTMGQVSLDRGRIQVARPVWLLLLVQQHQAQDLPMPRSRQGGCSASHQLGKLSCAGGEATPPLTLPDSIALLAASYTSGEDANVASPRFTYEDYAVRLVPPLDQPLHVQQSTACTVSPPSTTDSIASPPSIVGDSTSWSRLEELDPLTFVDLQWMALPSSGRLPKPHCNVLMAQLRDYLHTAVPTSLMDIRVELVDLHDYVAKIDREFKTQRYDDIDAPLLYIRIQIGEATCSALINCGATRNYMSQDFMVRAGLGPRVRWKSQPT